MADSLSGWPTGHVTFVFTDIEGSTDITHALENTPGEGANVYETQLRDPHRVRLFKHFRAGKELNSKFAHEVSRAGDGHFFVFQNVDDAIAAAVAFQQEMYASPITYKTYTTKVRIGIHRSYKEHRPTLDGEGVVEYSGDDTNYASRVASQGKGGQLLLSENTVAVSGAAIGAGVDAPVEWKNRRFKGFPKAQVVYEVLYYAGQQPSEPGSRFFPHFFLGEKNRYVARPEKEDAVFEALGVGTSDRADDCGRVAIIRAEGGMGKTRLAVACGVQAMGVYGDGVYFVSLARDPDEAKRSIVETEWLVDRVLSAIPATIRRRWGVPEGRSYTEAELLATVREREALLIFDNYESVDGDPARAFLSVLADTHVSILITTRTVPDVLTLGTAVWLEDGLTPDEAKELFLVRAQQSHRSGRRYQVVDTDTVYRDRILEDCAYAPLAIELAVAHVRSMPIKEIADALHNRPLGPILAAADHWDRPFTGDRHTSILKTIDWSFALLSTREKRAFAAASLFGGRFTAEMLCTVAEVEPEILTSLVDNSLVRFDDREGRYYLHHLTRAYARVVLEGGFVTVAVGRTADREEIPAEQRDGHDDSAHLQNRFVDYWLGFLQRYHNPNAKTAYVFNEDISTLDMLIREYENLSAAATVTDRIKRNKDLEWFGHFGKVLNRGGRWADAIELYELLERCFAISADRKNVAWMMHQRANVYDNQGRWDDAIKAYNDRIEIARELGDRQGEAASLHGLANVYNNQGRWDDAVKAYNNSIEVTRELGNRQGEAASLHGLANVYDNQGRWDDAIKAYNDSGKLYRELGDRQGEAASLHGLANVYHNQGRWDDAVKTYNDSIGILRELGNRHGEAASLHGLANVYDKQGRWDEAVKAYNDSIKIERELGNRQGEAASLHGLANVYDNQGRWDDAIKSYNGSIKIAHELGNRHGEAISIGSMATTLFKQGKTQEAVAAYRESIVKLLVLGDSRNAAVFQYSIAYVLYDNDDLTTAKQEIEKAVELYKQTEDKAGLANALNLLDKINIESTKPITLFDRLKNWIKKR